MMIGILDFSLSHTFTLQLKKYFDHKKLQYVVINVVSVESILNKIESHNVTHLVFRAPCDLSERKSICDELAFLIDQYTDISIFPSLNELLPYENKRYLATVLSRLKLPHPRTNIFFDKKVALEFARRCEYPIIHKTNIGASSSGVDFIRNKRVLKKIIKSRFGRFHPYLSLGSSPSMKKFNFSFPLFGKSEKHFIFLQDVIEFKWEWRLIKSGDVLLAYRKLKSEDDGFASGSGLFGYGIPPQKLISLNETVLKKLKISNAAIDYFETLDGEFLINEVQCLFGAKPILGEASSQMYDDDKNPIYLKIKNEFGDFDIKEDNDGIADFECWKLRMENFLSNHTEPKPYEE